MRVTSDEAPALVRIRGAGSVALPSDDRGAISRATVGQVHVSYVIDLVSMPLTLVVGGLEGRTARGLVLDHVDGPGARLVDLLKAPVLVGASVAFPSRDGCAKASAAYVFRS